MSAHLFDFKSVDLSNIYEINSLENNQISIEDCSKVMILSYQKKNPFVLVNFSNLNLDESSSIQVYQNLINQSINLNITIDFNFEGCSKNFLKMILSRWLSDTRTIKYIPTLIQMISEVILYHSYKNIDSDFYLCSKELLDEVIAENSESLEKIKIFFNSIPLFFQTTISGFETSHLESESFDIKSDDEKRKLFSDSIRKKMESLQIKIIDDIDYLPKNIISLFYNQKFLLEFYSRFDDSNRKFFLQQFTSYMYNGSNLYFYFNNENNLLFNTIRYIGSSEETADESAKVLKENSL